MNDKPRNGVMTASRMESILTCSRKHYWRYECGLQPVEAEEPLRFGSGWHRAMEAHSAGHPFEDALSASLGDGQEVDELMAATISGLLAGYYRQYGTCTGSVATEQQFELRIPGSTAFVACGKIDKQEGETVTEHKTTSDSVEPESDYWLRLRWNSQLFQYVSAIRAQGGNVSTVIYDVVRKPSIKPKQIPVLDDLGRKCVYDTAHNRQFKKDGEPYQSGNAEKGWTVEVREERPDEYAQRLAEDTIARPEFWFARREVPILDGDMLEFEAQRLTICRSILASRHLEKRVAKPEWAWPKHVSEMTCRFCPFSGFCLQNITPDLNQPPTGLMVGEFNPELQ